MFYTYDDFKKKAEDEGLLGEFSQADLNLAQQNPEVGMSMLNYKRDWHRADVAGNDDAKMLAHSGMEELKKNYGGYTGGDDGSGFYKTGRTPSDFHNPYEDQTLGTLGKLENRQFTYDPEADSNYLAYKKQYTREGRRATNEAIGAASASTGGIPSTYAATAGAQAGQYYSSKLADKVPELRSQAYSEFNTDRNADLQLLNSLRGLRSDAYGQFTDDINYDTAEEQTAYNREQDAYNRQQYESQHEREKQEEYAKQLAAKGDYSGYLELGMPQEWVDDMEILWKQSYPDSYYAIHPDEAPATPVYYGGGRRSYFQPSGATGTPTPSGTTGGADTRFVSTVQAAFDQGSASHDIVGAVKNAYNAGNINYDTYKESIKTVIANGEKPAHIPGVY